MKRILTLILSFATIFLNANVNAEELVMPLGNFENMRKIGIATVREVANPFTVILEDGRFIHLTGLDYPDMDFYDPGDLAVTAQEVLDDFLKDKKVLIYQTPSPKEGRVNRMNHHIAHLVRADNQIWVQGLLLSLGVARARTTKYNPHMAKQMLFLENKAREEKSGLWADKQFPVLSPSEAQKHIGSYQIVEGVIKSVSMRKNKLYLNFGHNWKKDFTIGISAFDLRKFTKRKIEPRRWSGRRIRVRGRIESYNGPYMDIDHPERIESLFKQQKPPETLPGTALPNAPSQPSNKAPQGTKKSGDALPNLND